MKIKDIVYHKNTLVHNTVSGKKNGPPPNKML